MLCAKQLPVAVLRRYISIVLRRYKGHKFVSVFHILDRRTALVEPSWFHCTITCATIDILAAGVSKLHYRAVLQRLNPLSRIQCARGCLLGRDTEWSPWDFFVPALFTYKLRKLKVTAMNIDFMPMFVNTSVCLSKFLFVTYVIRVNKLGIVRRT